jgi:hypothetical protein
VTDEDKTKAFEAAISKEFDLGKSGSIRCMVSEDRKRLHFELTIASEGLSKTGLNGLIDALKKMRDKMQR